MSPLLLTTAPPCSCSARPRLSPARRSMSARNPWMAPPALAARAPPLPLQTAAAASHSEPPAPPGCPRATPAATGGARLPQRAAGSPGMLAQHLEALRAHAARRQVHHALEGGVVVAV